MKSHSPIYSLQSNKFSFKASWLVSFLDWKPLKRTLHMTSTNEKAKATAGWTSVFTATAAFKLELNGTFTINSDPECSLWADTLNFSRYCVLAKHCSASSPSVTLIHQLKTLSRTFSPVACLFKRFCNQRGRWVKIQFQEKHSTCRPGLL